jgi:hypothetical protein
LFKRTAGLASVWFREASGSKNATEDSLTAREFTERLVQLRHLPVFDPETAGSIKYSLERLDPETGEPLSLDPDVRLGDVLKSEETLRLRRKVNPVDPHYCVFKCPPRSGPLPPYARIGNSLAVNSGKFR